LANANGVESKQRTGSDECSLSRRAHFELEGRLEARAAPALDDDHSEAFDLFAPPSHEVIDLLDACALGLNRIDFFYVRVDFS